jgi:hypothetical protein
MDIVIYSFIVGSGIHDQTNKPRSSFVGRAVPLNGSQGEKEKQQWKQLQVRVRMAFRASLVQWGSCMMSSKDRVWTKSSRSRGFTNVFSQKLGLSDLKKQAADAEKKGPPTQPVCPGTTISRKKMCLRSLDGKWIKCLGARYPIS